MRRDDWETPQALFDYLNQEFGGFSCDVAASHENAKCQTYYTEQENSLLLPWQRFFCNPPYSQAESFANKAFIEGQKSPGVILLPVRSDRLWFQRLLHDKKTKVCWITGRLHFSGSDRSAFMYNVIFYWHKRKILPNFLQAGAFNEDGTGNAKS